MSRPVLISSAAIVLLMLVATIWFGRNFELRESTTYVGFQGEARANPWLAARHFFRAMGVDARDRAGFTGRRTLGARDVLMVGPRAYGEIAPRPILDWVAQGGKLIAVVSATASHAFADAIGIRVVQSSAEAYLDEVGLEVRTRSGIGFDDSGADAARGAVPDRANCLVRRSYGQGEVVLLCDDTWFRNAGIGRYQHARALFAIVQKSLATSGEAGVTALWFVRHATYDSLLTLIWVHGRLAVVSGAILICLGLWAVSRRFGPDLPRAYPVRRSMLEHLEGTGWFQWKTQAVVELLSGLREEVLRGLPQAARTQQPTAQILTLVSNLTGESVSDCELALFGPPAKRRHGFLRQVQVLIRMNNAL